MFDASTPSVPTFSLSHPFNNIIVLAATTIIIISWNHILYFSRKSISLPEISHNLEDGRTASPAHRQLLQAALWLAAAFSQLFSRWWFTPTTSHSTWVPLHPQLPSVFSFLHTTTPRAGYGPLGWRRGWSTSLLPKRIGPPRVLRLHCREAWWWDSTMGRIQKVGLWAQVLPEWKGDRACAHLSPLLCPVVMRTGPSLPQDCLWPRGAGGSVAGGPVEPQACLVKEDAATSPRGRVSPRGEPPRA